MIRFWIFCFWFTVLLSCTGLVSLSLWMTSYYISQSYTNVSVVVLWPDGTRSKIETPQQWEKLQQQSGSQVFCTEWLMRSCDGFIYVFRRHYTFRTTGDYMVQEEYGQLRRCRVMNGIRYAYMRVEQPATYAYDHNYPSFSTSDNAFASQKRNSWPPLPSDLLGWSSIGIIPYWIVTTLLFVPGAIHMICWIITRRTRESGMCVTCGYDLRASQDRCPECGTPIPAPPTPPKPKEA